VAPCDDKEKKMADAGAEDEQLKQRGMRRLGMALGLIALAIAGLAVLDRYGGAPREPQSNAPGKEPPAVAALPPPKPIAPPPAAAAAPPPPPPSVEAEPAASPRGAQPSATPAEHAPTRAATSEAHAQPARSSASPPAPAAAQGTPAAQPAPLAPNPGYVIQLGMFTSVDNAQTLLERLKAQGVPAYLETRVVVGPFRDRAEADAAQRKLHAGGVNGVIAQRK
jgi:DedD protein